MRKHGNNHFTNQKIIVLRQFDISISWLKSIIRKPGVVICSINYCLSNNINIITVDFRCQSEVYRIPMDEKSLLRLIA